MGLCAPWVDVADLPCDPADFPPGVLERAAVAASELLYVASGRQFPGLCTDVVRPCARGWATQWLAYPDGSARPLVSWGWDWQPMLLDCGCVGGGEVMCGCSWPDTIRLPNTPVVEVAEILVDGNPLTPQDWTLVDDRWLARPQGWPWRQRLDLPSTEPDTWEITYTWGQAVPQLGRMAAAVLTCEFAQAWSGKACKLPKRVTQLVRENVSMTILDPFEFLEAGRFGVYEVDAFIAAWNPARLQKPAKLIAPRVYANRARRVR